MTFLRLATAATAALLIGASASAQTTAVFDLTSGSFANAYTFSVGEPSSVIGDTNSSGVTWFGALLQSPGIYTALDTNPDDGFSFTGLSAGAYSLTFLGSGKGGYGGYYTVSSTAVPEPESVAMVLAGLGVLGAAALRRRA